MKILCLETVGGEKAGGKIKASAAVDWLQACLFGASILGVPSEISWVLYVKKIYDI
jgi:hypothetical protein